MKSFLKINPADNVIVAIQSLAAGTIIKVDDQEVTIQTDIPAGQKCALKDFAKGEDVIKYGFPIGHACHAVKKDAS